MRSNENYNFEYDANGNLIKKTTANGDTAWTYQYDLLDRLIQVAKNGVTVASYLYDESGLRLNKTGASGTVDYVFNTDGDVLYEQENRDYLEYIYVLGKHFARVDGNLDNSIVKKYFYHTDNLGSTVAVTDEQGKEVWSSEYTPFGDKHSVTGELDHATKFTGKDLDEDTGLYYFNARWYDSELGRFVSEDPGNDPNSPNLYTYGANNPLIFIDPTGSEIEALNYSLTNLERYGWGSDPLNSRLYARDIDRWNAHNEAMAGFSFYQSTLLMQPEIYNNDKLFNMALNLKPFDNKGMTAFSDAVNGVYGKQFAALRRDISSKFFNMLVDFIPGIGDAKGLAEGAIGFNAVGEKLAGWERALSLMCLTELKDVVKGGKILSKIDNISSLGSSGKLWQEHHIILKRFGDHPLLKKIGFDVEDTFNKVDLPTKTGVHQTASIHRGRHFKSYGEGIKTQLDDIYTSLSNGTITKEQASVRIKQLVQQYKGDLLSGKIKLNNAK